MTLTIQNHHIKHEKVFKNKFTLIYEDPELEKFYHSKNLERLSNINTANFYVGIILIIFSLVNIFTFKYYNSSKKILPIFIVFLYAGITLNCIGLITSICIRKFWSRSKKLSFLIQNGILMKNFFIFNIYLFFSCILYDDLEYLNHTQAEIYVFMRIISVLIHISYVWLLLKNFKMTIILNLLIFIVQLLVIKFGTQFDSDYQIGYFCLLSFFTNFTSYYNEAAHKINLLLLNKIYNEIKIGENKKIVKIEPCFRCDNLRHSFFTANLDGRVTYANNSMNRMMTKTDERPIIEDLDEMPILRNKLFLEFNEFEIFWRNRLPETFYKKIYGTTLKQKEEQKILPKMKNQESMENYIKNIFGNLTYINEEMSISDPKLYDYLNKIKKDNKNATQINSLELNRHEFELKDLIKSICPSFPERSVKDKKNFLLKCKSEGMITTNHITENNLLTSNIHDNSEVHILKILTNPQPLEDMIKSSTIVGNSEFQLNIIEAPQSDSLIDLKENTVFLGKTSLIINNEQEEYFLYYSLDPDLKEIQFMLENISTHLMKERKEIANICRSLYLSKFSHELKNPLCNLLEIISNITDELNTIKIKKVLNPKKKNLHNQSGSEADSDSIIESSDSSSSLSENSEESEINKKIKNSPLPAEFKESKNVKNRITDNVKMLKCIGDMMMLIFQDFTFYSDLFGNERNKLMSPTQKNSNKKLNTENTSILSNRKPSLVFGDSPVVKSTGISSKDPSLNNKLSKLRFTSYKSEAKSCKFKEIIEDVVEIFKTKIEIENKKSKLSIDLKFDKNLPYSIDCDKILFKSMIFNIMYHLYLTTLSGKIEILLKVISTVGASNEILKKLNFEISVSGIINFNCDQNLNVELDDASFDSDLGIISSGEENNTNVNNGNKLLIPRVKNSNKSIGLRGKNSSNKLGFKNLKINLSSARRASSVYKNSKRERANSVITNHFAMKNILQTGCSLKRNSAVDKFNRNFQYNIFLIYSKKLGIKVNFEKNNSNLKVFFNYDLPASSDTLNIHSSNFISFHKPSTNSSQENNSQKKNSDQTKSCSKFKNKTGSSQAINLNVPNGKTNYEKYDDNGINEVILKIPATPSPKNNTECKSSKNIMKTNFKKKSSIEINKPNFNKNLLSPPLNFLNIQKDGLNTKSKHERRKKRDSLGSTVVISNGEVFNYPQFMKKYQKMKEVLNNNSRDSIFNDTVASKNTDKTVVINNGHLVINHQYFYDNKRTHTSNFSESKTKIFSEGPKKLKLSIPPRMPNNRKKSVFNRSLNSANTLRSNSLFSHRSNVGTTPLNLEVISRMQMENSTINLFRVLLCDDETLIRKTLQRFFKQIEKDDHKFSFEIEHADNGFECLNQIYTNHNEGKYFDLLIIDETMPFFKGSQITNLLKSMMKENHFKNITIVSFTSYDAPDKIDYIYSQGADFVISKPMKFDDFKLFFFEELYQTDILV
jgi:CheY-like chemotaxis protein